MTTQRVTREDLYAVRDRINGMLEAHRFPIRVSIEYAYGRPRAHTHAAADLYRIRRDLSPRLPAPDLYDWLMAYANGLATGLNGPDDDATPAEPEDPRPGDRITIDVWPHLRTGIVRTVYAYTDSQGARQYNIELASERHGAVYWKSEVDGGTWRPARGRKQ